MKYVNFGRDSFWRSKGDRMYYFSLTTVDSQNNEGPMSSPVELSTWGSGLPSMTSGGFFWPMFLPAITGQSK